MPVVKKSKTGTIPASDPMPELKDFDRLTCLHTIHHEHRGEAPKSIVVGHSRMLKTREEVYQRRFNATEEWKAVDLGWLDPANVGCVIIENQVGKARTTHPTKAEIEEDSVKILEVSYTKDSKRCDLIPPGAPDVKWPSDANHLYVRCQKGDASCRITVIPK